MRAEKGGLEGFFGVVGLCSLRAADHRARIAVSQLNLSA